MTATERARMREEMRREERRRLAVDTAAVMGGFDTLVALFWVLALSCGTCSRSRVSCPRSTST